MQQTKTRLLSALLALILVLGVLPIFPQTVSAATQEDGRYFAADETYTLSKELEKTPLTIEAVINVPTASILTSGMRGGSIVSNYKDAKSSCIGVELMKAGKIRLYIIDEEGCVISKEFSVDVRTGRDLHLAVSMDPDNGVARCYVNGVEACDPITGLDLGKLPTNGAQKYMIGGDHRSGNAQYFKGAIKSVAMYSNTRTAEEIAEDAAKWNLKNENLLVAYDLTAVGDDGLVDRAGNGNTLIHATSGMSFDSYGTYVMDQPLEQAPETIEVWLNMPLYFNGRGGVMLGNYYNSATSCINLEVYTNGNPRLYYSGSDGTAESFVFDEVDLRTGAWTHLVLTHDEEAGTISCYINGELKQTLSDATAYGSGVIERAFAVGGDIRRGNAQYFKGFLKEVAFYSDVRTAEEIAADYSTIDTADENLLLHFALSSATQNADFEDLSGNGYDVTYTQEWWGEPVRTEDYAYSFAIVGDTQTITWKYPAQLATIYNWIVDNAEDKNIQYVFGLGDITETDTDEQWAVAKDAITLMDGKLPYSLLRGQGHDTVEQFNAYFAGHEGYTSQIKGFYEEGSIANTYQEFNVGEQKYLVMCLDFGIPDDVIAWACDVIEAHPTHRVIITTHAYMDYDGTLLVPGDSHYASAYDHSYNNGDDIWENLVSKYPNIYMTLCGHKAADEVVITQATGDYGNTVTQILVDPQDMDSGNPTGMVAMLYFSADGSDVTVEYYSTIRDQYKKNKTFTISSGSTQAPSYDDLPEGYVVAQNTETGRYTVLKNTYFEFLGGSLRYGNAVGGVANIRFGYRFDANFELDVSNWKWNYGVAGEGLPNAKIGENKTVNNVTNLVITGVPAAYYASMLEVQLVFDVVIDGVTYKITDRERERSVLGVAQSMVASPYETDTAKTYAQTIIDVCSS